jgi:hypothetical protein
MANIHSISFLLVKDHRGLPCDVVTELSLYKGGDTCEHIAVPATGILTTMPDFRHSDQQFEGIDPNDPMSIFNYYPDRQETIDVIYKFLAWFGTETNPDAQFIMWNPQMIDRWISIVDTWIPPKEIRDVKEQVREIKRRIIGVRQLCHYTMNAHGKAIPPQLMQMVSKANTRGARISYPPLHGAEFFAVLTYNFYLYLSENGYSIHNKF